MANQIINKIGTSVIHVDSTDGEITLAELKNANDSLWVEKPPVDIVVIAWVIESKLVIPK